jgi:hypothetical protein|tara:strand:- start:9379 stop:9549 length:171 start_codon:yes stop_codon:yes gene_type:complete
MKWKPFRPFCYCCGQAFSRRELDIVKVPKTMEAFAQSLPIELVTEGVVCYNCKRYI